MTKVRLVLLFNVLRSSGRVGYLRATVEVSNFCKSLLFQRFGNGVARELLRREFGTGWYRPNQGWPFEIPLEQQQGARKHPSAAESNRT
jgi:hypothetical protein